MPDASAPPESVFGFRGPLGLVLAGGGALAAWQAGFVAALSEAGVRFDVVLGFSAGALTGAAYALGRERETLDRWRRVDDARVLRFAPRWSPLSLFSEGPVAEAVSFARDEEAARRALRSDLVVMSLRLNDLLPVYSRFTPDREWDGPLTARLMASCAIPVIFPPVRIREGGATRAYVDGGVPGREWMRFDAVSECRDLLVVEMVRPEEVGTRRWSPLARHDQRAREICREQINRGLASLFGRGEPPRVFRTSPSRTLEFTMLDFKSRYCAPAVDQGFAEGRSFLRDPARCLVRLS